MATKNVDVKILQVTKTTAEWATEAVASVVIAKGLLCVETTTDNQTKIKVGDGIHTFAQLPYATATYNLSGAVGTGADSDKYVVTLTGSDGSVDNDTKIPSYVGATASNYELLTSQPEDWETNYADYYVSDGEGGYTHVTGADTPVFQTDTYYKLNAAAAGVVGLVPAATAGTTNAYLRSDGTWDDTVLTSNDTLICI